MKNALLFALFLLAPVSAIAESVIFKCETDHGNHVEIVETNIEGEIQIVGRVTLEENSQVVEYKLLPEQRNEWGDRIYSNRKLPISGIDFGFLFQKNQPSSGNISVVDHEGNLPLYNVPCRNLN